MSQVSQYDKYPPGRYGLPHMGEVIADHRQRLGYSQEELAVVCGVDKQTVVYWERQDYIADMERRILLCKLLSITPALLGLTYRSLERDRYKDYLDSLEVVAERLKENAYGLYEDYLLVAQKAPDRYTPEATYRFFRHQKELEDIINSSLKIEENNWKDLLRRYYQFSAFIEQHHNHNNKALKYVLNAIELGRKLDNDALCNSLYRLARIYLTQKKYKNAQETINEAVGKLENNVSITVKGSVYLLAAEINALFAGGSQKERNACKAWQNQTLAIVHKGVLGEDGNFLNLYAVHHERAKTLLRFALFHTSESELIEKLKNLHIKVDRKILNDAQSALNLAKKHLNTGQPSSVMHYSITESKMLLLGKELEDSAKIAIDALDIARRVHSLQGYRNIEEIYQVLTSLEPHSPYIRHLGVKLGHIEPLQRK